MIADDRKESCIGDNRKPSQSRLLNTFRSAEGSKLHARFPGGKIAANNIAEVEEELLLQANLFLHFKSLSDVIVSFKTVFKTYASAADKLKFSRFFFQQLAFLFLSLKS